MSTVVVLVQGEMTFNDEEMENFRFSAWAVNENRTVDQVNLRRLLFLSREDLERDLQDECRKLVAVTPELDEGVIPELVSGRVKRYLPKEGRANNPLDGQREVDLADIASLIVLIDSGGGKDHVGVALRGLFRAVRERGGRVSTVATARAGSSAADVWLAGDDRWVGSLTRCLWHSAIHDGAEWAFLNEDLLAVGRADLIELFEEHTSGEFKHDIVAKLRDPANLRAEVELWGAVVWHLGLADQILKNVNALKADFEQRTGWREVGVSEIGDFWEVAQHIESEYQAKASAEELNTVDRVYRQAERLESARYTAT